MSSGSLARTGLKLVRLSAALAVVAADYLLRVRGDVHLRGEWSRRSARRLAKALGLEIEVAGSVPVPSRGLLACNHVSYLDIVALATLAPTAFVSKADVRAWPIFGTLAAWAGTIFIRREKRGDVHPVNQEILARARQGALVAVFPEGTSSDGSEVLPFRSSLLEPAIGHEVAAGWIGYSCDGGSVGRDVAYWGDMVFGPHLLKLLGLGKIRCRVAFAKPTAPAKDRKELALLLREQVCELGKRHRFAPAK